MGRPELNQGSYVPIKHWRRSAHVALLIVEIRKDQYLEAGKVDQGLALGLATAIADLIEQWHQR